MVINKRGTIELSVKSIVVLVIAVVVVAFLVFFSYSKFRDSSDQLATGEPEAPAASGADQVTLSRATLKVSSGEEVILKAKVYATANISSSDLPSISCPIDSEFNINPYTIEVNGRDIPAGQVGEYTMKILIPDAPKGKYICSIIMESFNPPEVNGLLVESEPMVIDKDVIFEVQ